MTRSILLLVFILTALRSFSQSEWLLYTRTIRDSHGNFRFDQNVVPKFTLNKLLRLEVGLRHGENTSALDAYYHYKIELQTRRFWNTVSFLTRMSDNIIKSPTVYSKSNYLAIAEGRIQLTSRFIALMGLGGVASFQRNGVKDVAPSFHGDKRIFPTYRVSLRYLVNEDWFVSAVYGAYDTFNPYFPESPFLQIDTEYDFSHRVALYAYFRYQYDKQVNAALNDFLGLGIRIGSRQ
ncbi:MAG TPA: hypothetical protein VFE50_08190 [Cyclobacteriaceae bacterium]|nr:hypothetical protein [Cyclobacteriaceae bacterium]